VQQDGDRILFRPDLVALLRSDYETIQRRYRLLATPLRSVLDQLQGRRCRLTAGLRPGLDEIQARYRRQFEHQWFAAAKLTGVGLVTADGTVPPAQHASDQTKPSAPPEVPTKPPATKHQQLTLEQQRERRHRARPYADDKSDSEFAAATKMAKEFQGRPGYSRSSCRRVIERLR
jgi:predicted Zn-dependent peptidase